LQVLILARREIDLVEPALALLCGKNPADLIASGAAALKRFFCDPSDAACFGTAVVVHLRRAEPPAGLTLRSGLLQRACPLPAISFLPAK
jgi:hypothetical protein